MSSPAAVLNPVVTHHHKDREMTLGRVFFVAGLTFLAHAPLIFSHFQNLWLKPHYQLFPVVLAGSFALVWPRSSFSLNSAGPLRVALGVFGAGGVLVAIGMVGDSLLGSVMVGAASTWVAIGGLLLFVAIPISIVTGVGAVNSGAPNPSLGRILVLVSWLLLTFSVYFNTPVVGVFSALLVVAATAITQGGRPLFIRCLPALAYLLLILPPPFGLDTLLVVKLQVFASKLSSKILDLIGVFHNLNGVIIEVGAKRYEVENACSGISSLLTTLACVLFYCLWFRIHWLRATVLTLASVGWVLLNNTARIVAMAYFDVEWGINLLTGLPHQIFGMFLFALTLFFIWSMDRLLMFLGRSDLLRRRYEGIDANAQAMQASVQSFADLPGAWYRSVPFAVLFTALAALQIAEWYAYSTQVPYSGSALSKLYDKIDVATLPETSGRWTRPEKVIENNRPPGHAYGEFSRVWRYTYGKSPTQFGMTPPYCEISFDFPFPEYHDLRVCYENSGWTLETPEPFSPRIADDALPLRCVRIKMHRPVELYGALWFCEFDQDGIGAEPTFEKTKSETVGERIVGRFSFEGQRWRRLFFPSKTAASTGLGSILQVQLMVSYVKPITDEVSADLEKLFVDSAQRIRSKCIELKTRR